MSEMIERMARSMWESHPNHEPWDGDSLAATPYQIYARAALEEMLEPDVAMLCVIHDALDGEPYLHVYSDMIRAALNVEEPT